MSNEVKANVVNFSEYRLKKLQNLLFDREISDDLEYEISEQKRFRNEIIKAMRELTNKQKKV